MRPCENDAVACESCKDIHYRGDYKRDPHIGGTRWVVVAASVDVKSVKACFFHYEGIGMGWEGMERTGNKREGMGNNGIVFLERLGRNGNDWACMGRVRKFSFGRE